MSARPEETLPPPDRYDGEDEDGDRDGDRERKEEQQEENGNEPAD